MNRFLLAGVGAALVVTVFTAPAFATFGGSNGKLTPFQNQVTGYLGLFARPFRASPVRLGH